MRALGIAVRVAFVASFALWAASCSAGDDATDHTGPDPVADAAQEDATQTDQATPDVEAGSNDGKADVTDAPTSDAIDSADVGSDDAGDAGDGSDGSQDGDATQDAGNETAEAGDSGAEPALDAPDADEMNTDASDATDTGMDEPPPCVPVTCASAMLPCGDCVDNDGDGLVDSSDPDCAGPCGYEDSFLVGIESLTPACFEECYFDKNSSTLGDDTCTWSHRCDPLEVSPNYSPEGAQCTYSTTYKDPFGMTCSQLAATQPAQCLAYCGPLTPNGCDCFGCCLVPGAPQPVWLGSLDSSSIATCNAATLSDPAMCHPCTQVVACLNTCAACELCIGRTSLPGGCTQQTCGAGQQVCGLSGQAPCPVGNWCITGCCQAAP